MEIALKYTKMTKSKKTSKTLQKFDFQNETKNNKTSSKMLLDHCYAFSMLLQPFSLKEKFFGEGNRRELFWPRPGSTPGRIWPKSQYKCAGSWVLYPYQV